MLFLQFPYLLRSSHLPETVKCVCVTAVQLRLAISSAEKLFHWRGRLVASSESKSSTELRACMDDLKAAGIENFIHVRVNVLETLKEYNAKLLK